MNKLVIIGNGFDLAHGLKTSYKDFILWYLNKQLINTNRDDNNDLISISSPYSNLPQYNSISDFFVGVSDKSFSIKYNFEFFKKIVKQSEYNWVDIEKEYYSVLVKTYKDYEKYGHYDTKELNNLNQSLLLIGIELKDYLKNHIAPLFIENQSIKSLFNSDILNVPNNDVYVLNFNYTSVVEAYLPNLTKTDKELSLKYGEYKFKKSWEDTGENLFVYVNHIHGELGSDNQIIFGYGDETDEYNEKLENLNDNEFLKHMKSFSYLQSSNYMNLFEFLDQENLLFEKREKFDVYIIGHSCGVSDRLLFTHILEHPFLNSVKIYYYEKKDGTNDFYEKTQELSRHFRKDAKHKMRKCVIPLNYSKPLPQIKNQN